MIINLQTEQPVLIKGFFKKIQEQTCRNEYVVGQKQAKQTLLYMTI